KTGLAIEEEAYEKVLATKDRIEALRAFAEKRKPNFSGE
nr:enoyl-CoA hydratase [Bacillaceae bacterium]